MGFLTKKQYKDLYADRPTLDKDFYKLLRRYCIIADSLAVGNSNYKIIVSVCSEIMATDKRLEFVDKDLRTCSNMLIFQLKDLGVTDEMLNEIDVDYGKMIDEENRIRNMSNKEKLIYINESKVFRTAKTLMVYSLAAAERRTKR